MTEETDVAVVGAGGGGAVLALALAKQGVRTVVLDQATGRLRACGEKFSNRTDSAYSIVWVCCSRCRPMPRDLCALSFLPGRRDAPLQHRLWRPTLALQSRHRYLAQRGPSCHYRGGAAVYECDIALWDLILRAGP